MKITFVSPYPDVTVFGVRTISAWLRQHGFDTQLIFLPDPYGDDLVPGTDRYEEEPLRQAAELCRESDIVGISLMTNFFDGAVQITRALRKHLDPSTPILWGGIHPTIRPEECLEFADLVCVGEGEDSMLELMRRLDSGDDHTATPNIWSRDKDGEIRRNELLPLPRDLDMYPMPDYSMDDHHVMLDNRVVPMTHDILLDFLGRGTVSAYLGKTGYQTMTSRGCPYACTYCINDTIRRMYGGRGKLRWRSIPHVMKELEWVKANMPYIDYIWISDDEFLARKPDEIAEFAKQYKEKINLPFSCLISPISVTKEKMDTLVDAGLCYVQMGVESGSPKMQAIFNRKHMPNDRMMEAVRIINSYRDRMAPPSYDFLMDVPGETDDDRVASLRFIADIPKPYRLQPFTLILYPGTELHRQAVESGAITNERSEIYNKTYTMRAPTYLNLLMALCKNGRFPSPLLKLLISRPALAVFNSRALAPVFKILFKTGQNIKHGLRG
jgi:anaerobic magnesium-protoporphyrin IX monomethyl ester cyclase